MGARALFCLIKVAFWFGMLAASSGWAQCPGHCPVAGGGRASVDCLVEYFGLAATPEQAARVVRCQDGDAACDRDGEVNGVCVFHASVCLNQDDPMLPDCSADGVSTFAIRGSEEDAELGELEGAVQALLPTDEAVCSESHPVSVPLRGTAERPRAGQTRIRSVARKNGRRDTDRINLRCVPAPRPLGRRLFSINRGTSSLEVAFGDIAIRAGFFRGFLELTAGIPDQNGIALIDVTDASEYIAADLRPLAQMIICMKPTVPAIAAGVIACKGQLDVSYATSVDHVVGAVGENGFTEADCLQTCGPIDCGTVEAPDGIHPGICNGPLLAGPDSRGDSGRGSVVIAADLVAGVGGLPAEITFVMPGRCRNDPEQFCVTGDDCGVGDICMEECGDGPPGQLAPLPLVSGSVKAEIFNANASLGETLAFEAKGQGFSCARWDVEDGPGVLKFAVPQLHAFSFVPGTPESDLITAFTFSDR